jgi:outer membrane protein OmpA-like peptidoglycan-associated protein
MNKKIISLSLLISCMALFSCSSKAGKGALIGTGGGAAVGAGIGALIGGKKGALIGGSVGAVTGGMTGAAIGARMDNQQKELEKVKGAKIERAANNQINVKFDSGILFDTGSANLKTEAKTALDTFSKVLNDYPETKLTIEGHTDSTGSKALNKNLSEQRAMSVRNQLNFAGVEGARMTTFGLADDQPVASNATAEGRAQNRRVEIKIVSPEAAPEATDKKATPAK